MTGSAKSATSYEILVVIHVTDDEMYAQYRAGITPVLESYGGFFRYDFRIEEVLKKEVSEEINRVFIISFPNREAREAFFADEGYLKVKQKFFQSAVQTATVIAEYERTTAP